MNGSTLAYKLFRLLGDRHARARIEHKWAVLRDRATPRASALGAIHEADLDDHVARLAAHDSFDYSEEVAPIQLHIESLRGKAEGFPIDGLHNGTHALGRLCYGLCRHLNPQIIVETGVAHGVTSTYLLSAMAQNGRGHLHSVDLPPLGRNASAFVGSFVPPMLRDRWDLRIGPAKSELPKLLQGLGEIDMFVHDSMHTFSHMQWEFDLALTVLRPGGVIVADDIDCNRAFEALLRHPRVVDWIVVPQPSKNGACGAVRIGS